MSRRTIRLPDRELTYTLTRSARRRTIGLKISEDGLSVVLPAGVGAHEADRAVQDKARWVVDRLDKAAVRAARPHLTGRDGEAVGWLGAPLRLIVSSHDRARTLVARHDGVLEVSIDARLEPALRPATVLSAVRRWRKREALALMAPKVEAYAAELGARHPSVSVREQKARWGSCSADGSIRMNARLIAYPEALIDYVCAHEACHLIEMNHSPRFHALLDRLMPDQRRRSRALKDAAPAGAAY